MVREAEVPPYVINVGVCLIIIGVAQGTIPHRFNEWRIRDCFMTIFTLVI
jgi:hypothetical protein